MNMCVYAFSYKFYINLCEETYIFIIIASDFIFVSFSL